MKQVLVKLNVCETGPSRVKACETGPSIEHCSLPHSPAPGRQIVGSQNPHPPLPGGRPRCGTCGPPEGMR